MKKNLPLSGLRVLDLSRVLAAPFAAQALGDLGAEVIKVERPGTGDDARVYGPPFLKDADGKDTRESAFYLSVNRNKKSITVDIATPEGQGLVRELARHSDVLIENYKRGDLARYHLDYPSLKAVNPRLVYCSVTGFGQDGPYSHRPGYDSIFQAMSGLMSVTGNAPGTPGGGPMRTGPSLMDIMAGHNAISAILAALYHRDTGAGEGQHIDIALLDSAIAANSHYGSHYLVSDDVPVRRGTEGNGGVPSRLYECRDGAIIIIAGNDEQFRRLCQALGAPALAEDPRFLTNKLRVQNRQAINEALEGLFSTRQVRDVLGALEQAGVPAAPIYDMGQVFDDPHVQARRMVVETEHPRSATGKLRLVGHAAKYSATPVEHYGRPPLMGEHTAEVLAEVLGRSAEEIDALRQRRVI